MEGDDRSSERCDELHEKRRDDSPADLGNQTVRRGEFAPDAVEVLVQAIKPPIKRVEPLLDACDCVVQTFVRPSRSFHASLSPQERHLAPAAGCISRGVPG